MLQTLYDQIMQKPKSYRKKLAYILTIIFGLFIVSLWLFITISSLNKKFDNNAVEVFQDNLPSLQEKYKVEMDKNLEKQKQLESLGY